jgi:parallel beta-helix repeat protein
MDTVIIDGDGSGNLVTVTANNVVFKNIYMRDANRLMYLDGCDTLYVTRCRFSDGADLEGIRFDDANYCTFYENNFSYNADVIIEDASTGNLFYHNNFYMGCNAVEEDGPGESGNHWNATYPVGGNYWHDHWYPYDVYSGPDQDIPGSDGIWDKPMDVGRGNKDYYPLAIPIEFGKNPPDILTPSPSNAQQNILVTFNQVRVYIEDPEGNPFDWTIQGKYIQSSGATGATAGWKTANIIGTLPYYQDVIWYVNATDSESNSVHAVYYFTTEIYEESDTNYVDDSYTSSDPEWHKSKWGSIQDAIDTLEVGGTIFIHAGTYYENILVDKSCNLIGSDKTTTTIIGDCGEDRGYVDMTVEVSALPYPDNGPVSHVNISNLRIENEIVGFYHSNCLSLSYLSYGDVYNCDFEYGWEGLAVNPRSNNITIHACSFTHFEQSGVVILGDDISITGCNLINLSVRGIMLDHTAERNLIQGNYIEDCSYGIDVHQATDTIIIENVLKDNDRGMTAYAIYISNSEDTIIYHNNFYGNSINAFDNSIGSKWNSSYPSGGNYYDDWDEVIEGCYDRYQGPNQDLPGMDGIVDSNSPNPYLIAGGANKDNYPFIYPYTQVDCQGADFTWTPKYPNPKKEVFFSETSCTMTKIVKWTWVYGDGRQFESIKTSESTHVYAKEGWYTVKLIIQDNRGEIYTSAKKIYVGNAPHLFPIPPSKYPGFTVPEMYMLLHATDLPNSNEQVTVMVIDSGIIPQKYNDIDLSKIQQLGSLSYSSVTDENGHGTWVNYAVAYLLQTKLPNSKQISYKVFDAEGGSTSDVFLTALKKAKELHPDIVSISAGIIGGSPDDPFSQACEELRREGIIVIVAGGNFGPAANTIASPGCSDSVIAVAGSDPLITDNTLWERSNSVKANLLKTSILDLTDDIICTWSSRGPVPNMIKPDITSPGESIIGPWLRGEKCVSGTSMATPLISGGTALIVAQNRGLIDLVKNLYFWDKSVIPQTFEDAIESSCYVKEDVNAWGAGIAQFDKINGNFQMGLYSRLIIWFAFPLILIIIIIILLYYYYREHRKGYTSYKLPKMGKSYKLPKIRKSYKIPKLIKR